MTTRLFTENEMKTAMLKAMLIVAIEKLQEDQNPKHKHIPVEKQINDYIKSLKDMIPVKRITLASDRELTAKKMEFSKFRDANYYFWHLKSTYSDAYYKIEFEDGETLEGSIDLEPREFWNPNSNEQNRLGIVKGDNPIGWHVGTFHYNVATSKKSDHPYITEDDRKASADLIEKYLLFDASIR